MSIAKNLKMNVEKAMARLPEATTRGFHDGREAGHDLVEGVPYAAGARRWLRLRRQRERRGILATPVRSLWSWAARAIGCGGTSENENHGSMKPA